MWVVLLEWSSGKWFIFLQLMSGKYSQGQSIGPFSYNFNKVTYRDFITWHKIIHIVKVMYGGHTFSAKWKHLNHHRNISEECKRKIPVNHNFISNNTLIIFSLSGSWQVSKHFAVISVTLTITLYRMWRLCHAHNFEELKL